MKKIYFKGLMEVEKTKTNQKVMDLYGEVINPETNHKEHYDTITTFSLTNKYKDKVNSLAKKFGISRSAVIRILLENVEL